MNSVQQDIRQQLKAVAGSKLQWNRSLIAQAAYLCVAGTAGPARYTQSAKISYAPNDTAATAVMERFAQGAACPEDPAEKEALSTTFHRYFLQQGAPPSCVDSKACMASPACWKPLMGNNLVGFSTEAEAVSHAVR